MRTFLQLCCLIAILCIKFCENEKNDIILGKALLLAFQQGVFYLSMIKIQKVLSLFVMSIQRLPAQCSIKQDDDKSGPLAISGLSRSYRCPVEVLTRLGGGRDRKKALKPP